MLEPILGKELNQVLVVDVVALLEAVMGSDNFTKSTTVWGGGEFVGHSCAKLGISGMFSGEGVIVEECPRYIEVE